MCRGQSVVQMQRYVMLKTNSMLQYLQLSPQKKSRILSVMKRGRVIECRCSNSSSSSGRRRILSLYLIFDITTEQNTQFFLFPVWMRFEVKIKSNFILLQLSTQNETAFLSWDPVQTNETHKIQDTHTHAHPHTPVHPHTSLGSGCIMNKRNK